jgi:hypothetical protein
MEEFCLKIMRDNPKGDWSNDWSFEQFAQYLRADLKRLDLYAYRED